LFEVGDLCGVPLRQALELLQRGQTRSPDHSLANLLLQRRH